MITCFRCKQPKKRSAFNPGDLRSHMYLCRDCNKNDPQIKARRKVAFDRSTLKRRKELQDYKSITPCVDCKKIYPFYVMEFDHRDPTTKLDDITHLYRRKKAILDAEIAKCDLLCSNCHQVRTYLRHHGQLKPS